MSAPLELSLVIPVYNERDNLPVLVEEIGRALAGRAGGEPYEIVAVDDGSTDGSLDVLKVLNRETIRDTGCSLKAFRAEALRALPLFNGMHRFLPTLVRMQGGQVTEVPVHHRSRRFGKTKYGMWNRVFRALIDALAVRWMQRRALRYRVREELP